MILPFMQSREYVRLEKIGRSARLLGSLLIIDISASVLITSTSSWFVDNIDGFFLMFFMVIGEYLFVFALLIRVVEYLNDSHKLGFVGLEDAGPDFRS